MADPKKQSLTNRSPHRRSVSHSYPPINDFDESLVIYMRQLSQMSSLSPDEVYRLCADIDRIDHELRRHLLATGFAAAELIRLIDRMLADEAADIFLTPSALAMPDLADGVRPATLCRWQNAISAALSALRRAVETGGDTAACRQQLADAVTRFDITGDWLEEWMTVLGEYLHIARWDPDTAAAAPEGIPLLEEKIAAAPAELAAIIPAIRHCHATLVQERTRILESNLQLVISVARNYRNRGLRFNDLIQEGNVGLMRALEKYDFRLGYRFNTYACWWIRQNITRAIAEQARVIRIPVHMLKTIESMNRAEQRFIQENDRFPEPSDLAAMLHLPEERVNAIRRMAWQLISLQAPLNDNDSGETLESVLPDPNSDTLRDISSKIRFQQLYAMIRSLPERDQQILIRRFGLYGQTPQSLDEVSRHFGLTRERIRQLEIQLLGKLRRTAGDTFFDGLPVISD